MDAVLWTLQYEGSNAKNKKNDRDVFISYICHDIIRHPWMLGVVVHFMSNKINTEKLLCACIHFYEAIE